jgi:hypothetical protein
VNNVENVISQLETQRSAIDRAISALREVAGKSPLAQVTSPSSNGQPRKRHLSPEGRRRIIAATKKRSAAKRANGEGTASKRTAAPRRPGVMSPEGRKRLARAMKKRWAAAKKAGKKQLA